MTNIDFNKFGEFLKANIAYRMAIDRVFSRKAVSATTGVSKSTICRAEKGQSLRFCSFLALVKYFDMDVKNYLLEEFDYPLLNETLVKLLPDFEERKRIFNEVGFPYSHWRFIVKGVYRNMYELDKLINYFNLNKNDYD